MKNALLALLLGGLVSGCASEAHSGAPLSPSSLSDVELCCTAMSDFYWTQLDSVDNIEFELNDASPVWKFAQGNSRFAAFELDQKSKMVEVILRSYMVEKQVVAPLVIALDEAFNVVQTFDLTQFDTLYGDALEQNRYQTTLQLDAEKTPYFVVYTASSDVGEEVLIPHPAKVRAIRSSAPLPMVTDLKYCHSFVGKLGIEVTTRSLRSHAKYQQNKLQQKREQQPTRSKVEPVVTSVQTDTVDYYINAIKQAVAHNDIAKALALLEEAKALNIEQAQQVFIDAVNKKQ